MQDRFTDQQLLAIVQDRLSGLNQRKTSEKYGISESSVKRIMRLHRTGKQVVDQCLKAG